MADYLNDVYQSELREKCVHHYADDTVKNRRNLVFASFIAIVIRILDLSAKDLSLFGMHLAEANAGRVTIVGLVLIIFWLVMHVLYSVRDRNLHELSRGVIYNQEKLYKDKFDKNKATYESTDNQHRHYASHESSYNLLVEEGNDGKKMLEEMSPATATQRIINDLSFWLPIAFGIISILSLGYDLIIFYNDFLSVYFGVR